MTSQMEAVLAMLSRRQPLDAPISERRAAFARFAALFAGLEDVVVRQDSVAGVPGLWLRPRDEVAGSVIVYVHGGGFSLGTAQDYAGLASRLAEACRMPVFTPTYRLAPEHPFPAARDDVIAVIEAMVGDDSNTAVLLMGDSAGANLIMSAMQGQIDRSRIAGIVCISGYFDLTNSARSISTHAHRDPFLDASKFGLIGAAYLAGHPADDPAASPLFGNLAGYPPTLLLVGSEEILIDDSNAMAARLGAFGVAVQIEEWAGMFHVWPFFAPMLDAGQQAIARIGVFASVTEAVR